MVAYKRSIKSQLSQIFCYGVALAFTVVIAVSVFYIYSNLYDWVDKTKIEIENL